MRIGLVFPGQGSQSAGMLASLAASSPIIENTFAEASAALGYDLWQLTQDNPEDKLNQTEFTQPALLCAAVAVHRLAQRHSALKPEMMAGHSLGEYTAYVCAGSLDFADACRLVATRGRLMQTAAPEGAGAMAAVIGLDDPQVINLCETASQDDIVVAANFNAIGQVVVSGDASAVERFIPLAEAAGARLVKRLSVSVPAHSPLMAAAQDEFGKALNQVAFDSPQLPVISNVAVEALSHPDDIRHSLHAQLCAPVRWVETVQIMHANCEALIEVGPGAVLCGLCKRITRELRCYPTHEPDKFETALAACT